MPERPTPEPLMSEPRMNEFALIRRYLQWPARRAELRVGNGDDGAVHAVPPGQELVTAMDTLVSGVHFFPEVDPRALGHKALAVNLSDLAAMGAEPAFALLSLTLPQAHEVWVADFARGFRDLAQGHGCDLIGGDLTRGPLAVTVQVSGYVPSGQALTRGGARADDDIWISGSIGAAGAALRDLRGEQPVPAAERAAVLERLLRPVPRVQLGLALRGLAHAAIDLSDGLAGDLAHIAAASGLGAEVAVERLPLWRAGADWTRAVTDGDDYELCLTAPAAARAAVAAAADAAGVALGRVGRMVAGSGVQFLFGGQRIDPARGGHDHFAG